MVLHLVSNGCQDHYAKSLRFGHLLCGGTCILSGVTLWFSYIGGVVLVPLCVCLACVEFLGAPLAFRFFCCLLFSSRIPTLFFSPNSLPSPTMHFLTLLLGSTPSPSPKFKNHPEAPAHLFWPEPSMTLETKLTMAAAGWSGSSSAKRWQMLSVVLPCFLATKPKSLGVKKTRGSVRLASIAHPMTTTTLFQHGPVHLFNIHLTQHKARHPKADCMKTHLFFPLL